MGYQVRKDGKSWCLYWVEDSGSDRKQRYVAKKGIEFSQAGFMRDWPLEQAREWSKTLQAQRSEVLRLQKIARTEARYNEQNQITSAYLPKITVSEFESQLDRWRFRASHWETAKRAIRDLAMHPRDWEKNKDRFYKWGAANHYSIDYFNTLRRAWNLYGDLFCEKTHERFKLIPPPKGPHRTALTRAYHLRSVGKGGKRRRRPSGRLSYEMLERLKDRFTEGQYRWLFISRAFGLRPEEVNSELWAVSETGITKYLHVQQPKLIRAGLPPINCWKKIPALEPEQKKALELIESGETLIKPKQKKFKGLFDSRGRAITAYSGRKDFVPSAIAGHGREVAADWAGHRSTDTTRQHYDDVQENSPPVGSWKPKKGKAAA